MPSLRDLELLSVIIKKKFNKILWVESQELSTLPHERGWQIPYGLYSK